MPESTARGRSRDSVEVMSGYRVHLLADAKPTERGVVYRRGRRRYLMAWSRVKRAFAAEVGEPQGVRTIVFDLVIEVDGKDCVVCRFDAEPGDEAQVFGRAIEVGIGEDRCEASLRAVAGDGFPTRSYPDLELFEAASLEAIRFQPVDP